MCEVTVFQWHRMYTYRIYVWSNHISAPFLFDVHWWCVFAFILVHMHVCMWFKPYVFLFIFLQFLDSHFSVAVTQHHVDDTEFPEEVCMYICMYVCMQCICQFVFMVARNICSGCAHYIYHICVCIYMYICACYLYMHTHTQLCMCICIHIHKCILSHHQLQ
jgi:hypothetical protein